MLLFWSLERLSREGVFKTLLVLHQLSTCVVKYRSLQKQWTDSLGAFTDAIVGILATVAKCEADRVSSRVRSSSQEQGLKVRRWAVPRAFSIEKADQYAPGGNEPAPVGRKVL